MLKRVNILGSPKLVAALVVVAALFAIPAAATAAPVCQTTPSNIYVNTSSPNNLLQYSPTGTLVSTVSIPGSYGDTALSADGKILYGITFFGQPTKLDAIDPSTGALLRSVTVTGAAAGAVNLNALSALPNGNLLTSNPYEPAIYEIDPTTGESTLFRAAFPEGYGSAGDFLTLPGGDILAVATVSANLSLPSTLFRIHPDGSLTEIGTVPRTFGAAQSGGRIYLAGADNVIRVLAEVPEAASTAPLPVTELATVSSSLGEVFGATAPGDSGECPSMTETKSLAPGSPSPATAPGQILTYDFTVTNTGNTELTGVNVADTPAPPSGALTSGPTCQSITAPGAPGVACSGNSVSLLPGEVATFRATYTVTRADLEKGQVSDSAIAGGTPPIGPPVTTPPSTVTVPATFLADLQITKTAEPATAVPGKPITYKLEVKNNGPSPAINATATDPLPSGLTYVSSSDGCSFASGKVTCAAGTLASGASKTFTVVAEVPGSRTERIENTATTTSETPDPTPGNNTSTVTTPIGPEADLAISKTASTPTVVAGGQVMYTLVVTNNGPSDATGVTVSDAPPTGLSIVSTIPSQGSCSGSTCQLGTIVRGGSALILVTANVAQGTTGQIVNTAKVIANNPDPNPGNNTGTSTVRVSPPGTPQPESDLQVVKRVDQANATPGQILTYTLVVTNNGPDTANEVQVTDAPSLPQKVLSAKASQGSCKIGPPLTCSLGTVAAGKSVTIKVRSKVLREGVETNTASATSAGRDPKPSNNVSAAKTKVGARSGKPRLTLVKTASARTVQAGKSVTYRLKVGNPTAVSVQGVKVCDTLPLGMVFQASSPKARLVNGRQCWSLGTVRGHSSKTITVRAKASLGTSGTKTNHATAMGKGVKAVNAQATVRVTPAPTKPTPVTG